MGGRKKVVGVGVADPFMQPTYSAEGAGGGEQAAQSLIGRWRVRTTECYSDCCSSSSVLLPPLLLLLHAACVTATCRWPPARNYQAGDDQPETRGARGPISRFFQVRG